jgi:hypothetical protein
MIVKQSLGRDTRTNHPLSLPLRADCQTELGEKYKDIPPKML